MADVEDMYLGNLDEFVNDEDKIVTYKWLSRTLSVPVNKAKQMLYAFVQKQKAEKSHLSITYIVGGRCLIDGEMVHRYVIAVDEKLEETKKSFSPVTSLHIYSIQKSKLKDSNALYTVDYGIQQEYKSQNNGWSHIYCPAAQRLAGGMTGRESDPKTSSGNGDDRTSIAKMVNGTSEVVTTTSPTSKVSSHARADQKSKLKAKTRPMSALEMFAAKSSSSKATENSQNIKSITPRDAETEESAVEQKKTGNSNPGSKKSFFGISTTDKKASEKPSIVATENETHPAKAETEVKQNPRETNNGKEKSNKGLKKKAVIYESDEEREEKPKKRRKRMRELPDEDGSDNESNLAKVGTGSVKVPSDPGSSRSESPLPPQQQLAQQSDRETTRRRKRRRTARSKTYMNEDGFMVTEKVWESESSDASDEEPISTKTTKDKPPSPGRIAGKTNHLDTKNKAARQVSLTSFFKKS